MIATPACVPGEPADDQRYDKKDADLMFFIESLHDDFLLINSFKFCKSYAYRIARMNLHVIPPRGKLEG